MAKLNKASKKSNSSQNKSNQGIKEPNKHQIKGKQNEPKDINPSETKNQKKQPSHHDDLSIKNPQEQKEPTTSKYKRRTITSNWDRYKESEDLAEESDSHNRGADFAELAKSKVNSSQFLQLREEKDWLEEVKDATLTVDCRRLERVLSQVALHIRLDLPTDIIEPSSSPLPQEKSWQQEGGPKFRPFFTGLHQSLRKEVTDYLDPAIRLCLPRNETPESLPGSLMDSLFISGSLESLSEVDYMSPPKNPSPRPCDSPNLPDDDILPLTMPSFKSLQPLKEPSPVEEDDDDNLDALLDLTKASLEQQGRLAPTRNLFDEWLQKFN